MNKYQEALNAIKTEPKIQDYYGDYINFFDKDDEDIALLQELVYKEIELQSRKDKLVVGSEWECIIDCYGSEHEFVVVQSVKVFEILDDKVRIGYDWIPKQQFLLCFKPKGEK